jgi:hypothetical protein
VPRLEHSSPMRRRRARPPRCAVALAAALAAGTVAFAPGAGASRPPARAPHGASADRHAGERAHREDRQHVLRPIRQKARAGADARAPLVFGIYPGGAAGTVGPAGEVRPEVAELRLQALETLRGAARPFVLHLYDAYTQPSDADALPDWLAAQIAQYTAEGFRIELVLTYRPAAPAGDVAGFAAFVRARVRQLGANANVTHLQVTNEANVGGAPDAADGAYTGARQALVRGTIAAKDEARRGGFDQLRIGFNWAYQTGGSEAAFFSSLRAIGGRAFSAAVDWVGLDAYPGTWGPALPSGDLAAGVRAATLAAMRALRQDLLPLARLSGADLHVSESGYPTGPGRTEDMQETVLRAAVQTVAQARGTYGVTDYRWFDLRDADSASPSFESRYGLTRDDYSPKPAFLAYRDLIATLG